MVGKGAKVYGIVSQLFCMLPICMLFELSVLDSLLAVTERFIAKCTVDRSTQALGNLQVCCSNVLRSHASDFVVDLDSCAPQHLIS